MSGDLLTCSATEISEQPGACAPDAGQFDAGSADAGTRDGGAPDGGMADGGTMDASVAMPVDAGVDLPPDPPACTPARDGCTCPVRYSSQITIHVPCCASICFASLNGGGWSCSATGRTERISSCE